MRLIVATMNEEENAFLQIVEDNLSKSDAFERIGFPSGYVPTIDEIESLTDQTCAGIGQYLPPG